MSLTRTWAFGSFIGLMAAVLSFAPVGAQSDAPRVSLHASRSVITYGEKVKLSGRIDPKNGNQRVNILSEGRVIASDTTNAEGRYVVWIKPSGNRIMRAQWTAAVSGREQVRVKPRVHTYLSNVRLFDKARANGRIAPRQEGREIQVFFVKKGRTIAKRSLRLRDGRYFSTRFRIRTVAPVRVKARLKVDGLAPGTDRTAYKSAPTPRLREGSRGRHVKILERRLKDLGYRLDRADKSFNYTTRDALLAFHKVQGLPRIGETAEYTWRALAHPKRPRPETRGGFHFEVDQTKQVLYIVRKGEVRAIVHVSTGANGYTRDGLWRVHRQLDGYSGGGLYYPSYFDGARAVHGWRSVPTYPASHGCVRTPMWIAPWLKDKAYVGMRVHVYHS